MKTLIKILAVILSITGCNKTTESNKAETFDVVIYGSTPAGIAAAVTAGRNDQSSIIIDPHQRIGGMPASGMSNTDFRTFEAFGGIWKELVIKK